MMTPDLEQLIDGYYHQDFTSVWGALQMYVDRSTPEQLRGLITDIEHILAVYPDDGDVEAYLDRLDNNVDRSREPGGYRGWLEEIVRRVRAHLDG